MRRRVRDILLAARPPGRRSPPAITAPVGRPDAATGHSDIWKLVVCPGGPADVSVRLPEDHGLESASWCWSVARVTTSCRRGWRSRSERLPSPWRSPRSPASARRRWMSASDTVDVEATSARQRVSLARSVDADRLAADVGAGGALVCHQEREPQRRGQPADRRDESPRPPELIDATQDRFATTRRRSPRFSVPAAGGGLDHADIADLDDHELNGPCRWRGAW